MKRSKIILAGILFRSVSILLVLTMLTLWLVIGLYARYTNSGSATDSARVAKGLPTIAIWEHKAEETGLNTGVYKLLKDNDPVTGNSYGKVLPGVDIPKDPYITLNGSCEVDFWLYVKITEEKFPPTVERTGKEIKTISYELNDKDKWTFVKDLSKEDGVYVYKRHYDAGSYDETISILKDDILIVSQYFDVSIYDDVESKNDGDSKDNGESEDNDYKFKLTFRAWVEQAD